MSMSRDCEIAKVGRDFYLLLASREHGTLADSDAFAYGPFDSEAEAERELDQHSNPGAIFFGKYRSVKALDPVRKRLVAKARPATGNCYDRFATSHFSRNY